MQQAGAQQTQLHTPTANTDADQLSPNDGPTVESSADSVEEVNGLLEQRRWPS